MTEMLSPATQLTYESFNRPDVSASVGDEAQMLQERFLTMLTTQLQLQDPFNPMDNFQMTSQLAQLSTVEGIGQMNQTLMGVLNATQQSYIQSQSMAAAGLIGKQTLDTLYPEHSPLFASTQHQGTMEIQEGGKVAGAAALLGGTGGQLIVKVYDSKDVTQSSPVREISIKNPKPGLVDIAWDGLDNKGKELPPGHYQFNIELENPVSPDTKMWALSWKAVESVTFDDLSRPYLILEGGNRLSMSDVFQIKAA